MTPPTVTRPRKRNSANLGGPTVTRFTELPENERALIRSVLNALNRAKTGGEADALALSHKHHRAAKHVERIDKTPIPDELLTEMEKDALDPEHAQFFDRYWQAEFAMLRDSLKSVARTGRLAGPIDDLVSTFEAFVEVTPVVDVSTKPASIRLPMRFQNASGAAAFVILRLAQLSAEEPAILCCEECETFALILPSVGSRMSRFCSTKCRNRANQRTYRESLPKSSAAKHK
jgi:hypothetical protein